MTGERTPDDKRLRDFLAEDAAKHWIGRRRVLLEEGLYVEHDVRELRQGALWHFRYNPTPLDGFCPDCNKDSIFQNKEQRSPDEERRAAAALPDGATSILPTPDDQDFTSTLICSRRGHVVTFYFAIRGGILRKVGQDPSFADIGVGDVDRFRGTLPEDKLRELKRGIGLAAHDAGIGAFVYLRRVFESLVDGAHSDAAKTAGWIEEVYAATRGMAERIVLLRGHLPDVVVDNAAFYGVLSRGVHKLTEQECLKAFPGIRLGITVILEAVREHRDRKMKEDAFRTVVGRAASERANGEESEERGSVS
jgi:hypothetical protein